MTTDDPADVSASNSEASPDAPHYRFHPAVIATAIALPVALIVGIIVAAVIVTGSDVDDAADSQVAVSAAVAAPQAGSAECSALMDALPDTLGDYARATIADPAPESVAAWRPTSGEADAPGQAPTAIIMRCGLERPTGFRQGERVERVDAVQWFRTTDEHAGGDAQTDPAQERATWFAVDRPVYVALTVPAGSGTAPIQEFSALLEKTLPEQPIDPAPYQDPGTPTPAPHGN